MAIKKKNSRLEKRIYNKYPFTGAVKQCAIDLGWHRQFLSNVLNGYVPPAIKRLEISKLLGCRPEQIF